MNVPTMGRILFGLPQQMLSDECTKKDIFALFADFLTWKSVVFVFSGPLRKSYSHTGDDSGQIRTHCTRLCLCFQEFAVEHSKSLYVRRIPPSFVVSSGARWLFGTGKSENYYRSLLVPDIFFSKTDIWRFCVFEFFVFFYFKLSSTRLGSTWCVCFWIVLLILV